MKYIFLFLPFLSFGQGMRDSLEKTGQYSPRQLSEMFDTCQVDVPFSGFTVGESFFCNTYISDTTRISLCSNGEISIKIGKTTRSRPLEKSIYSFPVTYREFKSESHTILKDTSKLLFTTLQAEQYRIYTELDELRAKVRIYEDYYGKIKGKPYNNGDCLELEPPKYPRVPCEPKKTYKKPIKKKA